MYNNRVDLKGNLTREPEYKDIKGTKLLTFRLAVNESIGKDKEETTYIDVEAWRNHSDYAESVGLKKGGSRSCCWATQAKQLDRQGDGC